MATHKVKLAGHLFDTSRSDQDVDLASESTTPRDDQLLWIDSGRDEKALARIDEVLGWKGLASRLIKPSERPRLIAGERLVSLSVVGLEAETDEPKAVAVDLVTGPNVVVTVHDRPVDGLGLPVDLPAEESRVGAYDEGEFVALLLDGMLSGYFRAVERVESRIDELDELALRASIADDTVAELVDLRRQIAELRRALSPQREVFYALERPGLVLGDSELAAWPLLADRFRQAVEAVENARELLVGTFDIVISRSGQRTNDVMRVLTVVSSVLLPAVVIAGIMGMNFKAPIFDDPMNFYIVLAATAILAISILLVARWRRWI